MLDSVIKRKKYLKRIYAFKDQNIIKVITGQRRVGKSYILKSIINDLKDEKVKDRNIFYLNKEDLHFDDIKNYKDLDRIVKEKYKKALKSKKFYLFVDEIQEIEFFEKAIRSFLLNKNFDIYISGSNSTIISSELSTFLSGRYIEIDVYPLDYGEFRQFSGLENNDETLKKYIQFGGLPFIHHGELSDNLVYTYTKNIYNTILLRDVVKKFEIRNVALLEKLVVFLCANIGYEFSANSISKYLKNEGVKVTPSVLIDYLHALKSSYFIHELKKYDLKGKRVFKQNSKYYINDLGIKNSITGYDESFVNQLMENIVCLHLMSHGYQVYTGILGDKEIDFVVMKNKKIKYIQVALTVQGKKTQEREFGNLLKIDDNYEKIVITMDPVVMSYKGIKHFRLIDFVSQEDGEQ